MREVDQSSFEIQIRVAVPQDWKTIADFNIRLAQETENKQLDRETIEAGVQTLLADERHGRYFVATDDSSIVGQMMHTREWSDWRNGEIWWLQSVYVRGDRRRCGIFRALFQHLESLAAVTPNIVGLRLYVEQHNAKALNVYESLGLKQAGYTVMERMFVKLC